jgi:uncharacterized membrane protein
MKTGKVISNVFSIIFFFIIIFQSCAAGVVNVIDGNETDSSGAAGVLLAVFMLVAAITGLITRKNEKSAISVGILYIIGALIGYASLGTFGDLVIWSSLSLIFSIVYFMSFILYKRSLKKVIPNVAESSPENETN